MDQEGNHTSHIRTHPTDPVTPDQCSDEGWYGRNDYATSKGRGDDIIWHRSQRHRRASLSQGYKDIWWHTSGERSRHKQPSHSAERASILPRLQETLSMPVFDDSYPQQAAPRRRRIVISKSPVHLPPASHPHSVAIPELRRAQPPSQDKRSVHSPLPQYSTQFRRRRLQHRRATSPTHELLSLLPLDPILLDPGRLFAQPPKRATILENGMLYRPGCLVEISPRQR